MKRVVAASVVVVLLLTALSGCGVMGLFMPVTQEEVDEAFSLSYGIYIASIIVLAFGGEVDGVILDEDTGKMVLNGVNMADWDADSPYTSISGSFTPSEDETEIYADLSFDGGAVVKMRYTLTEDFLDDSINAASATIEVVANYQVFTVTMVNE